PLAEITGVESRGLRWSVAGLTLRPDAQIGTSNTVTGPVHLSFDRPGALIILPRAALAEVIAAAAR
ncbi:MAG: thiamine pyrophosphokinase, partial [Pseudomonadota bacterium]